MSSKDLFNTDKENIPNNILPILEPDTIEDIPKARGRPSKTGKVGKPPSDYFVRKQALKDLTEENAKLRALLEKPVAIVAPAAIAKLPEPVVKAEPVKHVEPSVTTIEEIIKTIRPTKGRFW